MNPPQVNSNTSTLFLSLISLMLFIIKETTHNPQYCSLCPPLSDVAILICVDNELFLIPQEHHFYISSTQDYINKKALLVPMKAE